MLFWAHMARPMVVAGRGDLTTLALGAAICASARMVPSSWLEVTIRGLAFMMSFELSCWFYGRYFGGLGLE